MNNLQLPVYSMFVRPQGTGATTTDIVHESTTMLPKMTRFQDLTEELSRDKKQKFCQLKVHMIFVYLCS